MYAPAELIFRLFGFYLWGFPLRIRRARRGQSLKVE